MAHDRPGPAADRLLATRLAAVATRHARWGEATEAQKAAGTAELREIAGGRGDLLAETAGLAIGTGEVRGHEYVAMGHAVAEMCRQAGADEDLIPQWIEEGRRRVGARSMPPFSQPGRRRPRRG